MLPFQKITREADAFLWLLELEIYQEWTATFMTNKTEINGPQRSQSYTDSTDYNEKIDNDSLTI